MNELLKRLPYYTKGTIVKGFGRGSKEIGIPTANFAEEVVESLPREFETGIYFGFAKVESGPVYEMVMSVGWNPYYKNEKKSMETHIIHKFDEDLYGKLLRVVIVGYLRPEKNFNSLAELVEAIQGDIADAKRLTQEPKFAAFKSDPFFETD